MMNPNPPRPPLSMDVSPMEEQMMAERLGINPYALARQAKRNKADLDALEQGGMINPQQRQNMNPKSDPLDELANDPAFINKVFPKK